MIQPLQDLCLHKLNRDLMAFAVEAHNIAEVVDPLVYTYENTSYNIGRFEGVGSKLRDLVISFAVSQAETLVKHDLFRGLLAAGGEVVADFTTLACKRLE